MIFSYLNFSFSIIYCQYLKSIVIALIFSGYFFQSANAIKLEITPSRPIYGIKDITPLKLTVKIDTFSPNLEVTGGEIELKFDPQFLEVVDRTMMPVSELTLPSGFDGIVFRNKVDNFLGIIEYGVFTYRPPYRPPNITYIDFVEIYFRAKKMGIAYVQFDIPKCSVIILKDGKIDEFLNQPTQVISATVDIREHSAVGGGKPYNPKLDGNFLVKYNFREEMNIFILKIYNQGGKIIREVFSSKIDRKQKEIEFEWDGKDISGKYVANGVYIYHIEERGGGGVIYSKPKLVGVFK